MRPMTPVATIFGKLLGPWLLSAILLAIILGGCQTAAPVDHPCGVLKDSLKSVRATTPAGNTRLAVHYERGRAAGCWGG